MSKKLTKLLLVALVTVVLFALASFNAFASSYTDDGTGMDALIATALADAANEDVTITLNGTWTFTDNTVFGDPDAIPTHTITISGQNGAEIRTGGYMPSFCGHFVFENIKFVGSFGEGTGSERGDFRNGLFFPEGASCHVTTGCDGYADSTNGANLCGDSITVESGKFYIIAAQTYDDTVKGNLNISPVNNPEITIKGNASVYIVCGLGHNTSSANYITGKSHVVVNGTPTITYLVAGGWWSNTSIRGGKIDVDVAGGTITSIMATSHANGLYVASKEKAPNYEININASGELLVTRMNSVYSSSAIGTKFYINVLFNIEGNVKLNGQYNFFGVNSGYKFLAGGSVVTNIYDGYYYNASNNALYGGSYLNNSACVDDTDYTLNFYGGTVSQYLFGGPYGSTGAYNGNSKLCIDVGDSNTVSSQLFGGTRLNIGSKNCVVTGDSELEIKSGTIASSKLIAGGCYGHGEIYTDTDETDGITGGFKQTGDVTVKISGGIINGRPSFGGYNGNNDGSVSVYISGGTFNTPIYMLSDQARGNASNFNTCSITGDCKIYISGGQFNGSKITIGGANTTYYPANGHAVVGGNIYWEISGGTFSSNTGIYINGYGSAKGDVYMKFVGNEFDISNLKFISVNEYDQNHQANKDIKKIVDLSLVSDASAYNYFTKAFNFDNGAFIRNQNGSKLTAVYPALMDLDTIAITGVDLSTGTVSLAGATLDMTFNNAVNHSGNDDSTGAIPVNSYNGTYNDLVAWDSYASKEEYKTANAFVVKVDGSAVSNISAFAQTVEVEVANKTVDLAYTNTGIATAQNNTQAEFGYLGVSIRPSDNGLRARAYVLDSLRGRNLNDDGYKAVEYGVLVSKSATGDLVVGGAKTAKAVAFGGETDKFFVENGKYTFAAAVTNIKATDYDTQLIFRPYIILEDEAGIQLTIYADMTGVTNFVDGNNIKASLREVATYIKNNFADFYAQNESKIDAIIGG